MRLVTQNDVKAPLLRELGEKIYEMIGREAEIGGTTKHSIVYVKIPSGKSSVAHYHKVSEETYYILTGNARMIVDGNSFALVPGQACLIMPGEVHQIFNDHEEDLEFLAITAPAWIPDDYFEVVKNA
jgi:mannose-6-phosphate isomerase-like protein (cupin superfamily)